MTYRSISNRYDIKITNSLLCNIHIYAHNNLIINITEHIRPPECQLDRRRPDVPGILHFMITKHNSLIWTGPSDMAGNRTRYTQTPSPGRPSPARWWSLQYNVQSNRPHPNRQSSHFNPTYIHGSTTAVSLLPANLRRVTPRLYTHSHPSGG